MIINCDLIKAFFKRIALTTLLTMLFLRNKWIKTTDEELYALSQRVSVSPQSKKDDVITLKTKGLYSDDHELMHALKLSHEEIHGLNIEVTFTVTEINERELADLDQDLFDKMFGKDTVKTVISIPYCIKDFFKRC